MLNEAQKQTLRGAMRRRLAELGSLLGEEVAMENDERARQGTTEVGDSADDAADADMLRTEAALADLHQAEVIQLEAALARLTSGHYGLCADCRKPIAFDRLQANPTVTRCGSCQQQHESRTGFPGT